LPAIFGRYFINCWSPKFEQSTDDIALEWCGSSRDRDLYLRNIGLKKPEFSFLRRLTTWHCPHSPAAAAERRSCSNQSIFPARRAHSSSRPCMSVIPLVPADYPKLISLLRLSAHHLALAASAQQPLKSGTLSFHLSVPVPVLTPSVVISRPTTASRPSTPLNPSPLAPQVRLC